MPLLHVERSGTGEPALVLMPFLGGSTREWTPVVERLAGRMRSLAVDLPGFGGSRDVEGTSVAAMAESVAETLAKEDPGRFVLVGHSMAGKVSAVLARWAEDGDARLRGLEGLVLVAPSPPQPEPMTDDKRDEMLTALGGPERDGERGERRDREAAEEYIRQNAADDLSDEMLRVATDDVLRMNREAWRAWLERGSREDWTERVGVLPLPVLLVAGDRDGSLGPEVQRSVSMPHWPNGRLASLHSNHLIPMEKPAELTRLLLEFVEDLNGDGVRAQRSMAAEEVPVDPAYVDLLLSSRVSAITRRVLEARAEGDDPAYTPRALTVQELAQLRAVTERVLPQRGAVVIDVAARLDAQLAYGEGDGWRFATLPPDTEACKAALATLEWFAQERWRVGWLALSGEQRDEMLGTMAAGRLHRGLMERLEGIVGVGAEGEPRLDAEQMEQWFTMLRGDVARVYVAHPATLSRLGYSGVADGGDSAHQTGFVLIGEGEREPWEPLPQVTSARRPALAGGVR